MALFRSARAKMQWLMTFQNFQNSFKSTSGMLLKRFQYQLNPVKTYYWIADEDMDRTALVDNSGLYSYNYLYSNSSKLANYISSMISKESSPKLQQNISMLCNNDVNYVIAEWGIWMSGNVAVPLHKKYPPTQLEYYIQDSQSSALITTPDLVDEVQSICSQHNVRLIVLTKDLLENSTVKEGSKLDDKFFYNSNAVILYTSGTTAAPKGVVISHKNIQAMAENMILAWEWTKNDVILHALPLHHNHGMVNALFCPLTVGACCVMLPEFDPAEIWKRLLDRHPLHPRINMFMGVPTMYVKLLNYYEEHFAKSSSKKEFIKATCSHAIRLMVSGSSALPQPIFEWWEEVTGHRLLERYGMTEIGMALTNPLYGNRIPGTVGKPFPSVEVCIMQPDAYNPSGYKSIAYGTARQTNILEGSEKESGELFVKGPSVFEEYWNKPEFTKEAFTDDLWFKTGDTVSFKNGIYRIEGRTSVDIIKSGGYKISALEVERYLLEHPDIDDCAVVAVSDLTWGEKVAAIVATKGKKLNDETLQLWCKAKIPPYAVPKTICFVDSIPRNVMGKVNKKELKKEFFPDSL